MAKDTFGTHTPQSLLHIAAELEDHAAALKAASALLSVEPAIAEVSVKYENSRNVGFDYVRSWVNAVKEAAYDARLASHQKSGVRQIGPTTEKGPKRPKT